MAAPTIEETARLIHRLHSAGTVRRLDILHNALTLAYRLGQAEQTEQLEPHTLTLVS